ncbi:MAG: phosphatidylglycerophosphatase A [Desulfovibrio sp.]|nr:MAG: phosphatidylglycerophosphatase A [Desulfovibrio sp.]
MPKRSFIDHASLELCRLVIAGRSPVAPGTAGSAVAAVLAPFCFMPLPLVWRGVVLVVVFVLGGLAATRAETLLGKKDPGEVVIDELAGQWITYLPFAALSVWWLVIGFFLFRFFDIVKPFPIRRSEHWLPSGFGVMLDDVLAGGYALAVMVGLKYLFPEL